MLLCHCLLFRSVKKQKEQYLKMSCNAFDSTVFHVLKIKVDSTDSQVCSIRIDLFHEAFVAWVKSKFVLPLSILGLSLSKVALFLSKLSPSLSKLKLGLSFSNRSVSLSRQCPSRPREGRPRDSSLARRSFQVCTQSIHTNPMYNTFG